MRPIDADSLIDELSLVYDIAEGEDDPYNIGVMAAIAKVKRMPTIEPKRGKWESNEYLYTTRQTICSECKTEFYVDDLLNVGEGAQEYLPNFCPNCGAQMERGE